MHNEEKHLSTAESAKEQQQQQSINDEELKWDSENDPDNPFNWPLRKKWLVTSIACYVTFIVGLNASSITSASQAINVRFHINDARFPNSFWPVTSWTAGAAVAPMIVLPLMESFGIRKGYLISYAIFALFVVPQATAPNFLTLITTRAIAGCAGGVLQDVMDGVIADVWLNAAQRSLPVTFYVFSLLAGVSIGPVLGGAITKYLYWRWMFYIQLIVYGASAPAIYFSFSETRGPVILMRRTRAKKQASLEFPPWKSKTARKSVRSFLYEAVGRPAYMLCTESVVFFFTLLSAFSYGIVFVSTQSVTQVYTANYNWKEYQAGLIQAALVVGELIGFAACLAQNEMYARKSRSTSSGVEEGLAESRLYWSIPASFIGLSGGLFIYGWTSFPSIHWIIPSVGLGFMGFGSMVVMQAIMMYVTDAYAKYAASASAAVCFGENVFAAFLPLATQSMYASLGFQWASSLLGFVALGLSFAPIALVVWGKDIRRRSPFMQQAIYG